MKKRLDFKFWKYFIPGFGLFYLLWCGYLVGWKNYEDDVNEKANNLNVFQYIAFIFYSSIHLFTISFSVAWLLSIFGLI
jgi:hypothetical protein